jgi:hypothetical protein
VAKSADPAHANEIAQSLLEPELLVDVTGGLALGDPDWEPFRSIETPRQVRCSAFDVCSIARTASDPLCTGGCAASIDTAFETTRYVPCESQSKLTDEPPSLRAE